MSKARHARRRRSSRIVRTVSIAGLGAGLTATGAGAAFAADYTVQPGDTLSEIAAARGLDWHELAEINQLADPDLILVGQQLRLDGTKRSDYRPRSSASAERSTRKTEKKVTRSEPRRERTTRTRSSSTDMSAAWRKVANCESSLNPRAVSPAGYYGLFQFDLQTWRSVGGTGNPIDASASEQYRRAKILYAERGASPWPNCGRYLR